jgi:hypothetical protein
MNQRGSAYNCIGKAGDQTIFAKVLVGDHVPYWEPVSIPTGPRLTGSPLLRPSAEQIAIERRMGDILSVIAGPATVPRPLASSELHHVIVWDLVVGVDLDHRIMKDRWIRRRSSEPLMALERFGAWLALLHRHTPSLQSQVDLAEILRVLDAYAPQSGHPAYVADAARFLQLAIDYLGTNHVSVPRGLTHGDPSLRNVLWSAQEERTSIVDFEHAGTRPIVHDLVVTLSSLRAKLLNPLVRNATVLRWEQAFWRGYGPVPTSTRLLTEALAAAWSFYWFLPRILNHMRTQSRGKRAATVFYRRFFERRAAARALRVLNRSLESCWNESAKPD